MLIFVFAGFVKGVIGMGLPTVAMGFLTALMLPAEAAAILVLPSFVTNVWPLAAGSGFVLPAEAAAILVLPSFVTNVWQLAAGPRFVTLLRRLWPMLLAATVGTI